MRVSRTRPLRRVALATASAALAASCSGGSKAAPTSTTAVTAALVTTTSTATTSVATTTSTTAAPTTTTAPPPPREPFTGKLSSDAKTLQRPALVVKIDNAPERDVEPQLGLDKADIIFEEIVEGVTRFAAVFHSQDAEKVGPIRSARTSDLALLAQLSHPLLAWSGGNGGVVNGVRNSPFLYDLGYETTDAAAKYYRDRSRVEPHNLFSSTPGLYEQWLFPQPPPNPIFEYRAADAVAVAGDDTGKGVSLDLDSTHVEWTWNATGGLWMRSQYGHPHRDGAGAQHGVENVVILSTEYGRSPADPRSPEAVSVGSGAAWVLTAGKLVKGTWQRPDAIGGYLLQDENGKSIALTPGRTWVELPRPDHVALLP